MAQAIRDHCRARPEDPHPGLYSTVRDVTKLPADRTQYQSVDLLSITLKYLYLIFCEDDVMPLDQWVFSATGQPLPIRGKNAAYPDPDAKKEVVVTSGAKAEIINPDVSKVPECAPPASDVPKAHDSSDPVTPACPTPTNTPTLPSERSNVRPDEPTVPNGPPVAPDGPSTRDDPNHQEVLKSPGMQSTLEVVK